MKTSTMPRNISSGKFNLIYYSLLIMFTSYALLDTFVIPKRYSADTERLQVTVKEVSKSVTSEDAADGISDSVTANEGSASSGVSAEVKEKPATKAKKAKKVVEAEAPKTEKKGKPGRAVTKYDYPQVKDEKTGKMREMTSSEKKKYRMEQRKAANGGTTSKKKETKEAPVKKDKKKASKDETSKKPKKAKKVKKEED